MTRSLRPFVDSGRYPTRGGNSVRPWIDGEPAFRRICQAIEAARHGVWATITFMWPSFRMPDGRGAPLDVLESAARRGIDVRLICWRPDEETAGLRTNAFWGSADHFKMLARHYPSVKIRWDRAAPGYCQHQKSWLIDADLDTAAAFVGGINLNPHSLVMPGHRGEGHNHDVYVELAGPAVADVQHNFVQRWNGASERAAVDGRWGTGSEVDLAFPIRTPPVQGTADVQIQRTIHPGSYFDCAAGEQTNLDQYCAAIRAARRTIYLENQYLEVPEIVAALDAALARGVAVVLLLPAVPQLAAAAEITAARRTFLAERARLAGSDNFTLCGLAGVADDGARRPVYVHAKLMLVDDEWATVGSCNLHHYSLFGNAELNAAFHDPASVRALRVELFREHLAADTSALDDAAALRLFRRIAEENTERHARGDPHWQGLAFRLDLTTYGQRPQF
ncbi:MAG: phosphatidylserine/phosphatidylglycerophosphate/cardiolipin synthase family protein [Acidobacteria bacterium]|nr:phosphatidylserine/phosphatidylglycerophosphate/cardiolipin synthase family protein [Acidobacteriota bacterium]